MSGPFPSFQLILAALNHEERDRVPIAEVLVDSGVKQAFLGRRIETLQDDVNFWIAAVYDFIALDTDIFAASKSKTVLSGLTPTLPGPQLDRLQRRRGDLLGGL